MFTICSGDRKFNCGRWPPLGSRLFPKPDVGFLPLPQINLERPMKIKECMTRRVHTVGPDATLAEAARMMAEHDVGVLPVANPDRLIGMITDRDIAIRAIAEGRGPDTKVSAVMSDEVLYCYDTEEIEDVLANMGDIQVRRLPVIDQDKRLVGIVSLSDLADDEEQAAGEALCQIAREGGQHSQSVQ
jgi:CBS domain-containing protein